MADLKQLKVFILFTLLLAKTNSLDATDDINDENPCNLKTEYLCQANNQCIAKIKVCNFVNDCPDGQDEQCCGSCQFEEEAKESCGLDLQGDRVFNWKPSLSNDEIQQRLKELDEPEHFVQLHIDLSQEQLLNKMHLDTIIFEPMVVFPHLRPTDNQRCRFSLQMHSSDQIDSANHQEKLDQNWPLVTFYTIESNTGDDPKRPRVFNELASIKLANSRRWSRHEIIIGKKLGVWSLLIQVQTQISSDLLMLADFKFIDCQSKDLETVEKQATNELSLKKLSCKKGEFYCHISGLCIEQSLVCDFGHDCGQLDRSDELYCDEYQGRCDFEELDRCGWLVKTTQFADWLWVGAKDQRLIINNHTEVAFKPKQDHTYLSDKIDGHYMLLNAHHLKRKQMFRLSGPGVQLRPRASKCSLRFWVDSPRSLHDQLEEHKWSAYLSVGFAQIPASRLFGIEQDVASRQEFKSNWRRFEVVIFDQRSHTNVDLFSLELAFGNLTVEDTELFELANGYIALDDFSFSSGCELIYSEEAPESMCADDQFFCKIPTVTTGAYCIPKSLHCDFKTDCGQNASNTPDKISLSSSSSSQTGLDERNCLKECTISDKNGCKSFLLQDELEKSSGFQLVEPFLRKIQLDADGIEYLSIESKAEFFPNTQQNISLQASEININQRKIFIKETRIELPQFSMSHGGCTLELDYQWSAGRAENLQLNVYTRASDFLWSRLENLFEEQVAEQANSNSQRKIVQLKIGQNLKPFEAHIGLSLVGSTSEYKQKRRNYSGSLRIYSYKFVGCDYAKGLIDSSKQSHVLLIEDRPDDSGDYRDYNGHSKVATKQIDKTCPPGKFQCHSPILCLNEEFLCDMQRDCQLSGVDEVNCAHRGAIQFDFEPTSELRASWANEKTASIGNVFQVLSLEEKKSSNFARPINWPLTDHSIHAHTRRAHMQPIGHFLGLVPEGANHETGAKNETTLAVVYSPRMLQSARCNSMVLYLYEWSANFLSEINNFYLQVLVEQTRPDGAKLVDSLGEFSAELKLNKMGKQMHKIGWRRLQFDLPSATNSTDSNEQAWFTVALVGQVGGRDKATSLMISIDDVSFGPDCKLAANQTSREFAQLLGSDSNQAIGMNAANSAQPASYTGVSLLVFVSAFSVLAISSIILALVVYFKSLLELPQASGDTETNGGRVVSLTMDRISYERLENQRLQHEARGCPN